MRLFLKVHLSDSSTSCMRLARALTGSPLCVSIVPDRLKAAGYRRHNDHTEGSKQLPEESFSAIRASSAKDRAAIFRITWPL